MYVYHYTSDCINTRVLINISDSYCVGVRHRSAGKNFSGDITSKGSKVLLGFCSICKRENSMTVSDITIQAEGLGDFFRNLGKRG